MNLGNSFVKYINNSLNENNYFIEYIHNSLNENDCFVEYINNSLNQNNSFVEYINNSSNKNSSFVERIKLFRWILQHLINLHFMMSNVFQSKFEFRNIFDQDQLPFE